jgi:hypothetical protein
MKRRMMYLILFVQTVVIAILIFRPVYFFSDQGSQSETVAKAQDTQRKSDHDGAEALQLHIPLAMQKASDIKVERLSAAEASMEAVAWGVVLASSGLTEARMKLDQAQQEIVQAGLLVDRAQQEFDRLSLLWREGANIAKKAVDQAQHDLDEAQQKRKAARSARDTLRDVIRAEWGNDLVLALEDAKGGTLSSVMTGESRLLLIAEGRFNEATVALAEQPDIKMSARRLGVAPQAEPGTGKATWFWLAPSKQLRTGQRVRLIPAGLKHSGKVRVPESAVVWQAGQSWIFVQIDEDDFQRKAVQLGAPVVGGWQLESALAMDSLVVVQGAQLLLSEESRTQIRNENGD